MDKPTKRQAKVLEYIEWHRDEWGFPPTCAEIADAFGWHSPNAAHEHLKALTRKGWIEITPRIARGITVTRPV